MSMQDIGLGRQRRKMTEKLRQEFEIHWEAMQKKLESPQYSFGSDVREMSYQFYLQGRLDEVRRRESDMEEEDEEHTLEFTESHRRIGFF